MPGSCLVPRAAFSRNPVCAFAISTPRLRFAPVFSWVRLQAALGCGIGIGLCRVKLLLLKFPLFAISGL